MFLSCYLLLATSQWSLTFEVRKSSVMTDLGWSVIKSQWSLTFEVRKRSDPGLRDLAELLVAMEPDL